MMCYSSSSSHESRHVTAAKSADAQLRLLRFIEFVIPFIYLTSIIDWGEFYTNAISPFCVMLFGWARQYIHWRWCTFVGGYAYIYVKCMLARYAARYFHFHLDALSCVSPLVLQTMILGEDPKYVFNSTEFDMLYTGGS